MKKSTIKNIFGTATAFGIATLLCISILHSAVRASAATDNNVKTAAPEQKADETGGEFIYCTGSVSKIYSTAAVMKLADEGKLVLDDHVTKYIPDFKMADDRYKDITVRMLTDHTSGIMGTSQKGSFLYDDPSTYHHDHLLETLAGQRLKADPGKYAAYCNDGFDLLELIVENVSKMSYTDYVINEIAAPTGARRTGTATVFAHDKALAPAYSPENLLYDNESCMCTGAGGVYSTASDVAGFGASFFRGNDKLLSEESKDMMANRWSGTSDDHTDENGDGWDYVSKLRYEEAGVKVLGKGGDVLLDHAFLMVAPEDEISVAILSNGGSSMYNGMMAEALMDTVLNEKGIIPEENEREYTAVDTIPGEYDDLAGYYVTQNMMEGGATVCDISFPGHKYMHVESTSPTGESVTDYIYTTDGCFASLACEVEDIRTDNRIAVNPTLLTFEKKDDNVYIACDMRQTAPGLGYNDRKTYIGEKMKACTVSDEALVSFEEICGKDLLLSNDLPSSANYQYGIARAYMCREVPGYVFMVTGQGTRLLKIEDEEHAVAFQTIPSSSNRDLIDITLRKENDAVTVATSSGLEYISDDGIRELTGAFSDEEITGNEAIWYRIGDDLAGTSLQAGERLDNCAIYVYNKYGDVIFTTHVKDSGDEIPLPKNGKIVFLRK